MKALIFNEAGPATDVLQYTDIVLPEPRNDEVRIRIIARPINPSDEMFINGTYRYKPVFPQIAGFEGSGIIEKTGSDIDNTLTGKHVAFRIAGTWAENINLRLNQFRIVPESISFEAASQLSLNTFTAYALLDVANVSAGDWLVISAANSSVGKQIIQMAKQRSVNVIALIRHEEYKEGLVASGAKSVINITAEDVEKEILKIAVNGANAVLDPVGGELGTKLFNVAAPFSKMVIYGRLSNDNVSFNYGTVVYKNMQIKGFGIDNWMQQRSESELNYAWNEIIQAVITGTLKVNYDCIYELNNFKNAIAHYKQTFDKVILK